LGTKSIAITRELTHVTGELLRSGKAKGYLTLEEVNDSLSDHVNHDFNAIEEICRRIKEIGIPVFEWTPTDEEMFYLQSSRENSMGWFSEEDGSYTAQSPSAARRSIPITRDLIHRTGELLQLGGRRGYLTQTEINDCLGDNLPSDFNAIEQIYRRIIEIGIPIFERHPADEETLCLLRFWAGRCESSRGMAMAFLGMARDMDSPENDMIRDRSGPLGQVLLEPSCPDVFSDEDCSHANDFIKNSSSNNLPDNRRASDAEQIIDEIIKTYL